MSGLGLTIQITVYGAAVPARLTAALAPARLNPVIGRAATNTYRAHFNGLNRSRPNQLGGRRTNYYAGAARATSFTLVGTDTVLISINQVGIRQRVFGGTIKPTRSKYLTIPVAPEAHGKRAREFGDLVVIFGARGQPIALARKPQGKRGYGTILFRLVKSVTQRADPTVLAPREEVLAAIKTAVTSTIDRATRKPGSSAS
jgi:hypothetical protein